MSNEDLQAEGTINMGQVVQNMTYNAGSAVTNTIQGTFSNTTAFNLRGLGSNAILQLMDGKRVPTDNVNVLMPGIAIERMEIVTDGAAALYGTDAVAGVVNIVPVTSYDGLKIEAIGEWPLMPTSQSLTCKAGKALQVTPSLVPGTVIRSHKYGTSRLWSKDSIVMSSIMWMPVSTPLV